MGIDGHVLFTVEGETRRVYELVVDLFVFRFDVRDNDGWFRFKESIMGRGRISSF